MLKVAFALVGMGAYIGLFVPNVPITELAVGIAIALGILNLFGAKKSGSLQSFLVVGLMAILAVFVGDGVPHIHPDHFQGFFDAGASALLSTAGLVYISYVGVTHIASMSEEVKNPERNLPLGVFLALGTAMRGLRPGHRRDGRHRPDGDPARGPDAGGHGGGASSSAAGG